MSPHRVFDFPAAVPSGPDPFKGAFFPVSQPLPSRTPSVALNSTPPHFRVAAKPGTAA